ncbi:NAD-dependent epimerase/dehydratase family protein [bacterium]|nr:NAD-dependent epimerase/dehydratase family protein [bacterium]MCI0604079.1 NAD-dependent epimerase/dehydratase family protein [bacterium]
MIQSIVSEDLQRILNAIQTEAAALEGKTILIAGGSGFLGSYIVAVFQQLNRDIFSHPCTVFVLDNYITGSRNHILTRITDPNIHFVEHNVSLPYDMEGDLHYILHAAGIASPVHYRTFPVEAIESAIWGAKNLLELARRKTIQSFLFFSSSEIYGDPAPESIPTPETYFGSVSCTGPRACYDESKRLGETLCMTYFHRFGVSVRTVRPFNVYGPGMKVNDYRVIPTFLLRAMKGESLPVHNKGYQTRTFCYVSDAVTGFLKVLLSPQPGEVYNVGNDYPEISMAQLAQEIAGLFPHTVSIEFIEYPDSYPKGEPQRRVPDLSKIQKELGYSPQVDLRSGLHRTLNWFVENQRNMAP